MKVMKVMKVAYNKSTIRFLRFPNNFTESDYKQYMIDNGVTVESSNISDSP